MKTIFHCLQCMYKQELIVCVAAVKMQSINACKSLCETVKLLPLYTPAHQL